MCKHTCIYAHFCHCMCNTMNLFMNMFLLNTNQLESLQMQLESLQTQLEFLQMQLESLQTQLESLQTQLESLQMQLESLQTQMESLQMQLESLQMQLESLQLEPLCLCRFCWLAAGWSCRENTPAAEDHHLSLLSPLVPEIWQKVKVQWTYSTNSLWCIVNCEYALM